MKRAHQKILGASDMLSKKKQRREERRRENALRSTDPLLKIEEAIPVSTDKYTAGDTVVLNETGGHYAKVVDRWRPRKITVQHFGSPLPYELEGCGNIRFSDTHISHRIRLIGHAESNSVRWDVEQGKYVPVMESAANVEIASKCDFMSLIGE